MARGPFNSLNPDMLQKSAYTTRPPVPWLVAVRFRAPLGAGEATLWHMGSSLNASQYFCGSVLNTGYLRGGLRSSSAGPFVFASGAAVAANTWAVGWWYFNTNASRNCQLDGDATGAENTMACSPANINRFTVGLAHAATVYSMACGGEIAEVAVYDTDLSFWTGANRAKVAAGLALQGCDRAHLRTYWSLRGAGNVTDLVGGLVLTQTGTVAEAAEPAIQRPVLYGDYDT